MRQLQQNADEHHRDRLRCLTRHGHDAGENTFAPQTGDRFVDVGHIGVGIPRDIVNTAATEARYRRDQHQYGKMGKIPEP